MGVRAAQRGSGGRAGGTGLSVDSCLGQGSMPSGGGRVRRAPVRLACGGVGRLAGRRGWRAGSAGTGHRFVTICQFVNLSISIRDVRKLARTVRIKATDQLWVFLLCTVVRGSLSGCVDCVQNHAQEYFLRFFSILVQSSIEKWWS
eukprot:COSAG02_NODE_127_length_34879_cov_12.705060_37_plen_146_part_00